MTSLPPVLNKSDLSNSLAGEYLSRNLLIHCMMCKASAMFLAVNLLQILVSGKEPITNSYSSIPLFVNARSLGSHPKFFHTR